MKDKKLNLFHCGDGYWRMKTKNKIIFTLLIFLFGSVLGWIMSKDILNNFLKIIPEGIEVVALNPMEVFTTSLGISIATGVLVTLPFIFY